VTTTGGPGSLTFTKDSLTILVSAGQSVGIFTASSAADSPLLVDNSGTVDGLGSIGIAVTGPRSTASPSAATTCRSATIQTRGRLGLGVGTSVQAWAGTTIPFVIGSLWGNLSDDHKATLVSTGTSFTLKDDLQDVWGELSAGVNFFNPAANTSLFAKVDVTFGEDLDGVGGKAGMRVAW